MTQIPMIEGYVIVDPKTGYYSSGRHRRLLMAKTGKVWSRLSDVNRHLNYFAEFDLDVNNGNTIYSWDVTHMRGAYGCYKDAIVLQLKDSLALFSVHDYIFNRMQADYKRHLDLKRSTKVTKILLQWTDHDGQEIK